MKKQIRPLILLLMLFVLLLMVSGCSNFGFKNGMVTADITLSAETLTGIVDSLSLDNDSFVGRIDDIEFIEPNIMRITGEFRLKGSEKQSGSIDFAFDVTDDGLSVKVVNSTVPNLDTNSQPVQSFNQSLANALGNFASANSEKKGGITDIKVKDDALVITVGVKVR